MDDCLKFYINGEWVDPTTSDTLDVINPATEEPIAKIAMGGAADIDKAVMAARAAFPSFSRFTVAERLELFQAILAEYNNRMDDIAETISMEMGAPLWLSKAAQATLGQAHLGTAMGVLQNYSFEEERDGFYLRKEPIGVCGFITPWNWPINQIACKVAPALAAGCTMVLKPSEVAPMNAVLVWPDGNDELLELSGRRCPTSSFSVCMTPEETALCSPIRIRPCQSRAKIVDA